METLDWGQVTPEAANLETNEFVYIYNHDLTSKEKVDRTIRFILGRLNYYDDHLPKDPHHLIKIDARGQQVSDTTFFRPCWSSPINSRTPRLVFLTNRTD